MKTTRFSIYAAVAASVFVLTSAPAQTPPPFSITIDENGHWSGTAGIIASSGKSTETFFYPDASVLTYDFASTSSLAPVEGAVYIYDDAAHTQLSDVIVFAPDGPSYIYFMSLDNGGALADGWTTATLPSWLSSSSFKNAYLTEGANGVTTYTPTGPNGLPTTQPGFIDDWTATYTFVSNDPVPDAGSTLGLMAVAMAGLGALRRRLF